MAQGEGFKHITVTAAEDEDVVILAGATPTGDSVITEPATEEPVPEEPVKAQSPVPEPQPSKATKPAPSKRAKAKGDSYRETTLEDLEDTSMPFAQRVVIVAAIVCIIGAVIYCALFMG